ncbi:PepSY-associated TM helix domain-containing protein [Undibacterium sp. Ren11W]|uniref:PepSY-associated TM helix domain-containing protein n=1 Tax=Undibacterium sp. Ren11W TaxID=3413045 RepID=UPI003BF3D658
MFRRICLQLHWLIGISAGLVLAIMGLSGGMYSFSSELIQLIDPQITRVSPSNAAALSPAILLEKISQHSPYVSSLSLSDDPEQAARVGFMTPQADSGAKKFEQQYLNPYTAELLGKPASEDFFRVVLNLHRKLALDQGGKALTGAATLALLLLIISGMYLRWPTTKSLNWRSWLYLDWRLSGRDFLSRLHVVLATIAMLAYLVFALTSLSWSYEWYRKGLNALLGNDSATISKTANASRAASNQSPSKALDLAAVWTSFRTEVPHYQKLILLLPSGSASTVQILYLDKQAAHPYANNRMVFDAASGVLQTHERYADKSPSAKLMASLYALHSGSFFGSAGMLIMMLVALLMPVLAVTGWTMYLSRRR